MFKREEIEKGRESKKEEYNSRERRKERGN